MRAICDLAIINMRKYRKLHQFLRHYSVSKPKITIDQDVSEFIENETYKPRNHPGILKPRTVILPNSFVTAIENVTEDAPLKTLLDESIIFNRFLTGRHAPIEKNEFRKKKREAYQRVINRYPNIETTNEDENFRHKQRIDTHVKNILIKETYNWKPINYNAHNCLLYLIGRAAPEYSVLTKIFTEISKRDPEFKPRSFFDFGSGIGTGTWAAIQFWKNSIFEYFNVDTSADMNDLAQLLLQDGRITKKMSLRGVFYRQFLPSANTQYDLVVSSYSLFELPSRQSRLETIMNLWNKTAKYLVVVEQGTLAGFHIINEVREFILHSKANKEATHVFSPCPHEGTCPRVALDDGTPCNFEIQYNTLPIRTISKICRERYSYVVFKKGNRHELEPQWPRIVRPTLVRSKHTICRLCTKNCNLEEVIVTSSKNGKSLYHCARSSEWGDLLPITLEQEKKEDEN